MDNNAFTITKGDQTLNLLVVAPSASEQREATKVYNKAFTEAIKSQSIIRAKMDDVLREQGLWDDTKQSELVKLQSQISEKEKKLIKGGIKLSDGKDIALEMKELREKIRELISVRTTLDGNTAEGQADNAKFNYLVSCCVVYNDNNKTKYFNNLDDYLIKADDPVAFKGAQILANMLYGLDNDYEKNLPENKFLLKYKFVNENLRFINKDGKFVDKDGRLVDDKGRYINEKGEYIDKDGNRVDIDGNFIIDQEPFLDDDGNPIIEDTIETKAAPPVETEVKE
jgi:hypothetical protein